MSTIDYARDMLCAASVILALFHAAFGAWNESTFYLLFALVVKR